MHSRIFYCFVGILHRPPPFHKDYEDWKAWFLKLCIPTQLAPEVVNCAEKLPDTVGEVAFKVKNEIIIDERFEN